MNQILLRFHAPDPLGFMRDRESQFGAGEEKARAADREPGAGGPAPS